MKKFWLIAGIGVVCIAIAGVAYYKTLDYRIQRLNDQITELAASDLSCSAQSDCVYVAHQFEMDCQQFRGEKVYDWATSIKNPHLDEIERLEKLREELIGSKGLTFCGAVAVLQAGPNCERGRCPLTKPIITNPRTGRAPR